MIRLPERFHHREPAVVEQTDRSFVGGAMERGIRDQVENKKRKADESWARKSLIDNHFWREKKYRTL
jgi:hypothetical protein